MLLFHVTNQFRAEFGKLTFLKQIGNFLFKVFIDLFVDYTVLNITYTGLYLLTFVISTNLLIGKIPTHIDPLNMCVKEGATISAANFERVQGILSNPVAFLLSTVFNNQRTFLDTCIS